MPDHAVIEEAIRKVLAVEFRHAMPYQWQVARR